MIEPDGSATIYVQRGSNDQQLLWQVGHEMFHVHATPNEYFHWLHEGLAEYSSWELMRTEDKTYARAALAEHEANSSLLPKSEMLIVESIPYPDGFYSVAFRTAAELKAIVGRPQLMDWVELVIDEPNLLEHLDSLDEATQEAVRRVLS